MVPLIGEGAEQFIERGWAIVMEMFMRKKKEIRSLRVMNLEFGVIGETCTEDMRIMVQVINLLMN
jgi:hypothetical protein